MLCRADGPIRRQFISFLGLVGVYVRTELQNSKGNSNAIWKVINRCLPRKGAPLKTENPLSLSKTFNEFYTSVGKVTADKARLIAREFGFSPSGHGLLHNYANDVHENDHRELFMFSAVTESLVENIVNGLPSNKAPGADKITSRVLKDSLPAILPIITHLFNKSPLVLLHDRGKWLKSYLFPSLAISTNQ